MLVGGRLACVGVLAAAAMSAQGMAGGSRGMERTGLPREITVRGEITASGSVLGSLTVELIALGGGIADRTTVNADGSFEFSSVSPGMHDLRVTGVGGAILYETQVSVSDPYQELSISLPDAPGTQRSGESTVSVRQILHKIPAAAQKMYAKGRSAAGKGNYPQAVEYFLRAVSIDPEFADAYNDLGASYAAQGKLPQAVEQFQKAVNVVPDHPLALTNLCIALSKSGQAREAGEVARRALKVSPGNARVHFILAASLAAGGGGPEEVLDHLQRAAAEIPRAHLAAAELLANNGRRSEAAKHLEQYLQILSPQDAMRPKLEAWLAELRTPVQLAGAKP